MAIEISESKQSNNYDELSMSDSAITKSTGEHLNAWPLEERAPLMHWMADLSSANEIVHRSQFIVWLYCWSHLIDVL